MVVSIVIILCYFNTIRSERNIFISCSIVFAFIFQKVIQWISFASELSYIFISHQIHQPIFVSEPVITAMKNSAVIINHFYQFIIPMFFYCVLNFILHSTIKLFMLYNVFRNIVVEYFLRLYFFIVIFS